MYDAWAAGHRDVLMQLDTGGGKTAIFSKIIHQHDKPAAAIAHRQELIGQISLNLATLKIPHRIIAPDKVISNTCKLHTQVLGTSYHDPNAAKGVVSVDTLPHRVDDLQTWLQSVTLLIQDEAHHNLRSNKWGKAHDLFPNAFSLGVTATPYRTDGKGLGRHADGIYDVLIKGPGMRDLINQGYLTDYKIWAPPTKIDLTDVNITSTGDYSPRKLSAAIQKSTVVGDVVEHYLKLAPGKLGLTFSSDVQTAADIARQFTEAGIPAEVIHAKTADSIRVGLLQRFKNRELLMLVNVDIFGEGFDCPAIEVVIMARPTQSLPLYMQQFGRALRPLAGKDRAIIIDHAGNVARHGLPDAPRQWSLNRRDRRTKGPADDSLAIKVCPACTGVYERKFNRCPHCGYYAPPAFRSGPQFVDGDLIELDEATLAAMRGAIADVDLDKEDYRAMLAGKRVPVENQMANVKRHAATQVAQEVLRNAIRLWAGYLQERGDNDSMIYRQFYLKFGTDILTAQALRERDAKELTGRVGQHITEMEMER